MTASERLAVFLEEFEGHRLRVSQEVTLVVITKFHPASLVRELFGAGCRDFGENRHQEAREKVAELQDLDAQWHFVGQIQSKKARQIAEYATVLHSVDSESVVQALERREAPAIDGFVQVNLTEDPARGGVSPDRLLPFIEQVEASPGVNLLGLMAVAPLDEEPSRAFARLAEYSEQVRTIAPGATSLSAGMSNDWKEALQVGATHLRIGSAITGNRPDPGYR
ncbi:YggS family pyridoxal phosphate-dependent enzyme [Humidisolicoccus flavus]|uniref:YggS family pyridoxal phosphate-dependent enzyme n=1 Tax=Humidisolicoccus flavus TaxID=3111414 RepID=UPI00324CAEE3